MKRLNSTILTFVLTTSSAWAGLEGNSNTKYGMGAGNMSEDNDVGVFIGVSAGYYNTTGNENTFVGAVAGFNNTQGSFNTFIGGRAGSENTTGFYNVFVGKNAGSFNSTGGENTFLGMSAGYSNTRGAANTFLGRSAGYSNTTGTGNVFLGNAAGYFSSGSNRLYIDNSNTTTPLIYGEFDTRKVTLNGNLDVVGPDAGIVRLTDATTDVTTKGARLVLNHYYNSQLPVYMLGAASTASQNILAFGGG